MKNNIILTAISADKDCNTYEVQFYFCKDVIYNDEDEVKNNIARFTSNFRIMNVQMKISFFQFNRIFKLSSKKKEEKLETWPLFTKNCLLKNNKIEYDQ